MTNSRLADIENRLAKLERFVSKYDEDRQVLLDLVSKCSQVIGQTNERLDKHFDDQLALSDRLNLTEGMVEIFKDDLNEIRNYIFFEEDDEVEYETS